MRGAEFFGAVESEKDGCGNSAAGPPRQGHPDGKDDPVVAEGEEGFSSSSRVAAIGR